MSIDKVSGTSWTAISKIDGVASSSMSKVVGIEAPSGIVTDNLWIDLRPDDYSGTTVTDQSGNGRSGTLYNGATVTTTPSGETAFYTDGVNDAMHYRITSSLDKPSTGFPFTAETWLYRDDTEGPAYSGYFGKPHNSRYRTFDTRIITASNAAWSDGRRFANQFYTNRTSDADNTFYGPGALKMPMPNGAIIGSPTSSYDYTLSSDTSDQTWYHVVVVWYEDGSSKLTQDTYVNGTKVQDGAQYTGTSPNYIIGAAYPWEGAVSATYPMSWGYGYAERYTLSDIYRQGYGGDFRMYTDRLSDAEILQNFNATKSNYGY